MAKPRIRQNRFDNWYGYLGNRRVEAFGNSTTASAEENAKAWLAKRTRIQEIRNALKVGAGVFTGALTNELDSLLEPYDRVEQAFANDAKRKHLFDGNGRRKYTLQDALDESAEKFRKGDL
jgi:hypothetical protein